MPTGDDRGEKSVLLKDLGGGVRRIGVVSDTHIPRRARFLPPEVLAGLEGADLILHAGDLVDESVLIELEALAPVEAVAGNMDPRHLHERLGRRKLLQAGGLAIGLIHGDGSRGSTRQRAKGAFRDFKPQVIVFGHSHQSLCEYTGAGLLFNPGSCVDPRWAGRRSYGLLHVGPGGDVRGEIIFL